MRKCSCNGCGCESKEYHSHLTASLKRDIQYSAIFGGGGPAVCCPPILSGSGAIEAHCPHSAQDYKLSIATGERLQARMLGNEFANPPFKARRRGWPDLEPEATQNATQAHLDIMKFYLHQLARGEQRPRLLRCNRLAMHRAEPAQPH